jgi:acetyltransferase
VSVANLDSLFKPRSIALFGANKTPRTIGSVIAHNLLRAGFDGPVMPVHASDPAVRGVLAYRSIEDLPMPPDLAVIALPPPEIPPLIEQLGARGTRAVVVLSPDFEANGPGEGAALRARMLAAAKPYTLRIVGPACLGVVVPREGVNASWAQAAAFDGDLAFVSQSGSLMTSMLDWAAARGVGFSLLASLGDMTDVDFGDILDYLALDPETRAVLLCVDHIAHPRKFLSAARAAARLKPVIVFDAGRHEAADPAGRRSSPHISRVEAYDAAFRRAGLLPVPTLADLVAAAGTVATGIRLSGDRLVVLTNGRGIGDVAGNLVLEEGGQLAELSGKTVSELDRVLPHTWGQRNPINLFADATAARWRDAMGPILADPNVDAVVAINAPTAIGDTLEAARSVAERLARERKPVAAVWLEEGTREESRRLFAGRRVSVHDEPGQAIEALMQLVRWHRSQEMLMQTPAAVPDLFANDAARARAIVQQALAGGRSSLSEEEGKQLLAAYGMPVVDSREASTTEEALSVAAEIGLPITLRTRGRADRGDDSAHGGDAIIDLRTAEEIETAARRLVRWYQDEHPGAAFPGFAVARSVDVSRQYELRIGIAANSAFGPMMVFGRGGAVSRVYRDQSVALPPLNLNLARRMIEETRVYRLLHGYGERPPANLDEIAEALVRVSQIACDVAEIVEINIDPLLADEHGVLAVETSVLIAHSDQPAEERLAIRPYPAVLEKAVASRAGKPLRLRPIRPEDEPALQAFVRAQSPEDRRLRFFSHVKELDHRMAARLTQIDYDREMALVLVDPAAADNEILGVMRISADADGTRAEYAGAVRSDLKGEGFGRLLLEEIIAYAAKRGIGEVWGEVLAENAPMLGLVRKLGFIIRQSDEDPSLMIVAKRLG